MKDIVFDISGKLKGVQDATSVHQEDILIMHKGWNKFYPHVGVGIVDYISDSGHVEALKSSIASEFERDGMKINELELNETGKISIDATY